MLILPSVPKLLLPVQKWQWREPSAAQQKDQFGRQNRTRFVIRLWKLDGALIDERWYDDRDEFDHDLFRFIIEEPYADIFVEYAVTTTLTSPTGSNQTYSVPADWNNAINTVECIGGGASGGAVRVNTGISVASGGGGGGYGIYANLSLSPGGSATYQIGATAAGVTVSTVTNAPGNAGNSTWFDGTTYAGASVGGAGGTGGTGGAANQNGGAGGAGNGTASFSGGRGGNYTGGGSSRIATGGGAAAGRSGNGGNGTDLATSGTNTATAGGTGDNGTGGAGSAGPASGTSSSAGGDGTEMDGIGAGGGSGGAHGSSSSVTSGAGGNYGAGTGGGAKSSTGSVSSGTAAQGAIWITYTPVLGTGVGRFLLMFN